MNKIHNEIKAKATSLAVLLVSVFLLSALAGTQLIGNVSGAIAYTQYTGTLNGADWALRIPDPWNGMLVMCCRGYMGSTAIPNPVSTLTSGTAMLNGGFAVAASSYGAAGFSLLKGVDSTHQLTNYIIDTYHVTGKVFLFGMSMGGSVVLLLGEKYPEVYSGVLDMYGGKDWKNLYTLSKRWANLSDTDLAAELTALGIPVPPPGYTLQGIRNFMGPAVADQELATGGTPETVPQVYEACSPTYHANIQIPVITVHGTFDVLVPYYQSLLYQDAVARAYRSDLYRLYTVPGAGHGDSNITAETIGRFNELVAWSNELTGSHDWPMFHHDLQHTGYSTSNAPTANYTLWTYKTGGGVSSPAVVDGKLYVGAGDGRVYCLDAATGTKIWNYTTGAWVYSSPAVVDGRVYVGSNDKNLYCLDAATGVKIWNYTTGSWVGSSPTVANGKVYVGSDGGKLYCLRADWGQVEWIFTTGGGVANSPTVVDGKVYFGSWDSKLYCVGASTGALIWSYTTGDKVWSCPAVVDGKVYFGSYDDKFYCLDAATGAKIWSYTTGDNIDMSSPAVVAGKVYIGSYDDNVYCLDAATGTKRWNFTTGNNVYSSPVVADGKVYIGSFDKSFYCLDATTGALIWSYAVKGQFYSSAAVANGVVYIGETFGDTQVYAFSPWQPIPEGSTIGVMLLLSAFAVIVSARYYRKRPKWQKW